MIFAPDHGAVRRIEAEDAVDLRDGAWQLSGVKDWPLGVNANPERDAKVLDTLTLAPDSRPSVSATASAPPPPSRDLAIAGLHQGHGGRGLLRAVATFVAPDGFALPLMLAAMVLIAAGFNMAHVRPGQSG